MTYSLYYLTEREHPEYYMPRELTDCPDCGDQGERNKNEDMCFCNICYKWFEVRYVS